MPRWPRLSGWLPTLGVVVLVAACGTGDDGNTSEEFAGTVDIGGGRNIYLECAGTGTPTVVFVSGLRFGADQWTMTLIRRAPRPSTESPSSRESARTIGRESCWAGMQ